MARTILPASGTPVNHPVLPVARNAGNGAVAVPANPDGPGAILCLDLGTASPSASPAAR